MGAIDNEVQAPFVHPFNAFSGDLYGLFQSERDNTLADFETWVQSYTEEPDLSCVWRAWDMDGRPDNTLRPNAQFKLADPGFAKFQTKQTKENPYMAQTKFSGRTGTFGSGALERKAELRDRRYVTSVHRSRNVLPVLVNGAKNIALPDTMSLANVISEEYAISHGAFINRHPSKRQVFKNAVGKTFTSIGQAAVSLSFPDTPGKVFTEVFSVVSNCAASLVLGNSFLQAHEIMTRFRHRLEKLAVSARKAWRLMHMDIPYQKFVCDIENERVAVNVDTGSEKNFISHDYLRYRRWKMQRLSSNIGFVELADGEIVKVSGYVDKEICIGWLKYEKRFYILDGLMCDVLLGDETIEETDLYNEVNNQDWVDFDASANYSEFHAISWLDEIEDHVSNFLNDGTYQILDRDMQDLLNEVQQQGTQPTLSPSPHTSRRKWWRLRQNSQPKRQTRVNEQYQLLHSGIWTKLSKLDNAESEARETSKQVMSQASGDDLRKLQTADEARRQEHMNNRTRLLELRSKLLEWRATKTNSTP